MSEGHQYRLLPNMENHGCFGCGHVNKSGLRMEFFTDEVSIVSWVTVPGHLCGWSNLVHGGIIATMLDEIMGRSVIYIMKKVGLTKSMEIDFIKPAFIGRELRIEGRVKEVNGDREVLVEGVLYNGEGEVCARSKGTFAIFPPDKIRQWGIGSEEVLDWLERFLQRS